MPSTATALSTLPLASGTSTSWEPVDAQGRVHRADYRYGRSGVATCSTVGLGDGRLVLVSPPGGADTDALYTALDGLGEVAAIVAPNAYHRVGLPVAATRYPQARIYAPPTAVKRVGERAPREVRPLDALAPTLPPEVEIFTPPHMKSQDTMVRVQTPEGVIWTQHDLILNMTVVSSHPIERWLLGLLGYKTGLRVNRFGAKLGLLKDPPAFASWWTAELQRTPPVAVVPGHGPVLRDAEPLARIPALIDELGRL